MPSPPHLILRIAACLSASCLAAACSSSDSRAQAALAAYQDASAANDVVGARNALLQLVRAKDDVADYWIELGKLQSSSGSYGDAYYAFTRAYELDRRNPDVLRDITELALRTGDLDLAKARAGELDVVSPGDPWVKITRAWAAIRDRHYDEALAESGELLANDPFNGAAIVLKARALMGFNRQDEAEALLIKQVQSQPSDLTSARLLAKLFVRKGDWVRVTAVAQRIARNAPTDRENALLLVEAAFRSGNVALGRAASAGILRKTADPDLIGSVLDLWSDYWSSPQRLQEARMFANSAGGVQQKVVYASFLNREGSPADAVRLISSSATLPVDAVSADSNAVLGDALWRLGKPADAKSRLDAVIAYDPGNPRALRGRAELELMTRNAGAAIPDAQKLVTVLRNSADDRLLLARCYAMAGNKSWADRTLWAAFQDIPADEKIYAALQTTRKNDPDATLDLREEFDRQRDAKLNRGLL